MIESYLVDLLQRECKLYVKAKSDKAKFVTIGNGAVTVSITGRESKGEPAVVYVTKTSDSTSQRFEIDTDFSSQDRRILRLINVINLETKSVLINKLENELTKAKEEKEQLLNEQAWL